MIVSAGATRIMTPTHFLSKNRPAFDLENIVPVKFGRWVEEKNAVTAVVDPEAVELMNKLYAQTLSRTYVNDKGERVMLSIAYGVDQRNGLELHRPEVCYPSQGFQINSNRLSVLATPKGEIVVTRLETSRIGRSEPVTYWTTIGDKVTTGGIDKKMLELRFGLKGVIPDGLLFRVSSVDKDTTRAFSTQDLFVNSLFIELSSQNTKRLMGLG